MAICKPRQWFLSLFFFLFILSSSCSSSSSDKNVWNHYCVPDTLLSVPAACKREVQFSSVQSLSRVRLFATPWIAARQASLSITNTQSSLRLTSIESVMPSSHFILCHPLLLLPPIPPSIRVFSNESTLRMRWPKYWSFSFSISPSSEHPGLISFRMDRLDLLAVQGTPKETIPYSQEKICFLHKLSLKRSSHNLWSLTCNKYLEIAYCMCQMLEWLPESLRPRTCLHWVYSQQRSDKTAHLSDRGDWFWLRGGEWFMVEAAVEDTSDGGWEWGTFQDRNPMRRCSEVGKCWFD